MRLSSQWSFGGRALGSFALGNPDDVAELTAALRAGSMRVNSLQVPLIFAPICLFMKELTCQLRRLRRYLLGGICNMGASAPKSGCLDCF